MTDLRRDISLFVSVARIEAALYSHRLALQRLPLEVAALDRALADLDQREQAVAATLEDLAKTRRDTEKHLREHEEHLRKCKGQQSLVKTNDEYTAMLKEISTLERQIGDEEEKILGLMDRIDQAKTEAAALTDKVVNERALRTRERDALATRVQELSAEVERLTRERPKLLSEISAAFVKRYERLAEKHKDIAVTRVDAEHCGACRQQLPPQLAVEVRKNEQFITCPACGRILVHYES